MWGSPHTVGCTKWANYSSSWIVGIVLLILNIIKNKARQNKARPFLQLQRHRRGNKQRRANLRLLPGWGISSACFPYCSHIVRSHRVLGYQLWVPSLMERMHHSYADQLTYFTDKDAKAWWGSAFFEIHSFGRGAQIRPTSLKYQLGRETFWASAACTGGWKTLTQISRILRAGMVFALGSIPSTGVPGK